MHATPFITEDVQPIHVVSLTRRIRKRTQMLGGAVVLSGALTAAMSLLFHGRIRVDFMATGLVCAVVVSAAISRITLRYRRALAQANQRLEQRVARRTAALEDALRRQAGLQQQLLVQDRMATAGALAAGISHEIRNPLTAITAALDEVKELLAAELDPAAVASAREAVIDAEEAAARVALIAKDLATVARPVEDPLGEVDLAGAVASACRLATYQIRTGSRLEQAPIAVPPVIGNAARLVQVVLNLLVNAARAARPGRDNLIRVAAEERAGEVVLTVADTGIGIPASHQSRLFEPFFTTRRDQGGTGLGLNICRSLVESAGGRIVVDSVFGSGTTVSVHLRAAAR